MYESNSNKPIFIVMLSSLLIHILCTYVTKKKKQKQKIGHFNYIYDSFLIFRKSKLI